MSELATQPRLLKVPMSGLLPIDIADANRMLVRWGHRLGPANRPFRQEAYALELDGRPVSVAVSASIVSATVAGYGRQEVVELARLCSDPAAAWATRVMLRLWREVCAPRWDCWPVRAAISYSHNAMHRGTIYRMDGWERITETAGSSGGGAWSRPRYGGEAVAGSKTLWVWRYDRGLLEIAALALTLGISTTTLFAWIERGLVPGESWEVADADEG